MTFNITDEFRVNAGLRYTEVEKSIVRNSQLGTTSSIDDINVDSFVDIYPLPVQTGIAAGIGAGAFYDLTFDRSDNDWTPSIGVEYDLAEDIMVYASYSDGFKAGGFDMSASAFDDLNMNLLPDSPAELENFTFDPETVDAFEAGVKAKWLDGRLTTNLNVFRSTYSNLQQSTLLADGVSFRVQNAGKSRSEGVEFDFNWIASSNVMIGGNLSYLDSKFIEYVGATPTAQQVFLGLTSQDLSGSDRPFSPEFSGNIFADIRMPLANEYVLSFQPNLFFTSSYFIQADLDPGSKVDSFAKIDLRVALSPADERWEVAIVGKNLTNKDTPFYLNDNPTSTGSRLVMFDRPRTVALQGRFNF